jgi:hypothetical protein
VRENEREVKNRWSSQVTEPNFSLRVMLTLWMKLRHGPSTLPSHQLGEEKKKEVSVLPGLSKTLKGSLGYIPQFFFLSSIDKLKLRF